MKKDFLVGYTGFVGSNIKGKHLFSRLYNSKNISEAYGGRPDLLVYAGVPAEMFLANSEPDKDMEIIKQAMRNIEFIAPKQLVLISTVAVYPQTKDVDENTEIDADKLPAYGANRYALEKWAEETFQNCLVIRLPALFGDNLKKNFLYDLIHYIPPMLKQEKFEDLSAKEPMLTKYYIAQQNGYYKSVEMTEGERKLLKSCFQRLKFSALNFTDSRSKYQFYDLRRLWGDIETALKQDISRLNITTPPIQVRELYNLITREDFVNELDREPFDFDIRSIHSSSFGGENGYLMRKETEIDDIKRFLVSQGVDVK